MTTPGYVLDSGALIALERSERRMTALLAQVQAGRARFVVPDAVVAQVWRSGTGRQTRVAALLGLKPEQCTTVPLDTSAAKRIGRAIAACGHSDVVDVHVAVIARDHHASLITSDRGDLVAVDPSLAGSIIDI